ncbi:MAG TPA: protein-L-isoaspartate O-methyltransferase, partial [Elusimicrobiales bacterium]|nr:protein-L-isoaspartate O-methyltransferase [Elusimicrobiales bacterium]
YMTELLELRPGDRVLEIGTGSGYQAAVLAKITPKVFSMEILCSLERTARATLDRLGFGNVRTRCADGYKGWPEEAPFDAIILTAAPPRVPRPLLDQLAEGGRLVAPVGNRSQDLVRIRKVKGKLKEEKLLPVIFVPMTGEARKKTPAAGVAPERKPDVDFVPTPHKVVREMLRLARVTAADTVYDLGCGDGRILITAAGTVGARGRGFEIDHFMAEEARLNAEKAKVGHLVTIEERDIFTVDLSSASVVALYLLPEINVKLLPQLSRLRPGARVVSHDFGIEGYPPDAELTVPQYDGKVSKVYLWTAPLRRTTDYFAKD